MDVRAWLGCSTILWVLCAVRSEPSFDSIIVVTDRRILDKQIRALGMPRHLRDVGVAEDDLPRLAQNCMLDDWTFSNPRPISAPEQIMEILRMAY